jgi:hypothetical protein
MAAIERAGQALSPDRLQELLIVFSGMGERDYLDRTQRSMFNAVANLLARVRDIQARRYRELRRADRQIILLKDSKTNEALRAEFDALTSANS